MRKRTWAAARQPGSRVHGKVWHGGDEGKELPRIREKRMWLGGICLGVSVAVAACGTDGRNAGARETTDIQSVQDLQETTGTQNEEALREQVLSEMTDEQKNWMGGLSREQRLADFESLCKGLQENYPYVKLAARQVGADLDALETEYRSKVEQCENDDAFFYVLKDFVGTFSYTGHLALWGRRYESELADKREYVEKSGGEERERMEPYLSTLDNPVSHDKVLSGNRLQDGREACRGKRRRAGRIYRGSRRNRRGGGGDAGKCGDEDSGARKDRLCFHRHI